LLYLIKYQIVSQFKLYNKKKLWKYKIPLDARVKFFASKNILVFSLCNQDKKNYPGQFENDKWVMWKDFNVFGSECKVF
jgi:hypothetical protein